MDGKTETVTHDEVHNGVTPKKGGIMNTLYPPGPKPGAVPRVKNHCRKFWWCDLLVAAIIILIIVLPIVYVGIPNIAQKSINESSLEVTAQEVTNPRPDEIYLKLTSVAKSDSAFHPTLDSFEAELALEGKEPFLAIQIPKAKTDKEFTIQVEQDVKILDVERFTEYTMTALGTQEFEVKLNGKTKLKLNGLDKIDVDYKKTVKMTGLNKLAGLKISDLQVLVGDKKLEDGSNLLAKAFIPNPSVMTLTLGNVTLNLAVDGEKIGESRIYDLVLRPGDNNVDLESTVEQSKLLGLISSKYKDYIIPLEINGNSTIYNGKNLVYFEKALQSNKIELDLDIGDAIKCLTGGDC